MNCLMLFNVKKLFTEKILAVVLEVIFIIRREVNNCNINPKLKVENGDKKVNKYN